MVALDGHEPCSAGLLGQVLAAAESLFEFGVDGRQTSLLEDIRDPSGQFLVAGVGSERLRGRAVQRLAERTHVARDPLATVGPERETQVGRKLCIGLLVPVTRVPGMARTEIEDDRCPSVAPDEYGLAASQPGQQLGDAR